MGDIFDSIGSIFDSGADAVDAGTEIAGSGAADATDALAAAGTDLGATAADEAGSFDLGSLGAGAGGTLATGGMGADLNSVAAGASSGLGGFINSAGQWIANNPNAALIGGSSLVNGILGTAGAVSAANTQADAAAKAGQTLLAQYNQTRGDLLPYNTAGQSAVAQLAKLYGLGAGGTGTPDTAAMQTALEAYPGYQFALGQGTQAIDRSAAAKGTLLSGGTLKDLTNYAQGAASSNFGNYLSGLNSLASLGESAGSQTGNIGASIASGIAGTQTAAGTANASGTVGATNAATGALSGGVNNYLLMQALANRNNNPSGYNSGSGF